MLELLSQSWWEPGSAGVFDVGDMAIMLGFALAVIGAATGFSRWWLKQLRRTIHEEVEEYTKPIQPSANGGLSLPDVARKVERMEDTVENIKIDIKEDNKRIEKSIDDLREENRQTWGMLLKHLMKNDD
jgi:hypothetical protein